MYFILNTYTKGGYDSARRDVLAYYETEEELRKYYPNISSTGGSYGFMDDVVFKTNVIFVNYLDFQEEDYKKKYPTPSNRVRICTIYLRKIKIKKILESLSQE